MLTFSQQRGTLLFFSGLTSTSFVKLYFKRIEEGHQNKTHTKKEEEEEERNEIET